MIQANKALGISKQYQAMQEYINEIDKCIKVAAAEGKTTCQYKLKIDINIEDDLCDVIINYLRQNGYKTLLRPTFWIDILRLEISWGEEPEEEEN